MDVFGKPFTGLGPWPALVQKHLEYPKPSAESGLVLVAFLYSKMKLALETEYEGNILISFVTSALIFSIS